MGRNKLRPYAGRKYAVQKKMGVGKRLDLLEGSSGGC